MQVRPSPEPTAISCAAKADHLPHQYYDRQFLLWMHLLLHSLCLQRHPNRLRWPWRGIVREFVPVQACRKTPLADREPLAKTF